MSSRALKITLGVILALVLICGIFSAGIFVGAILPQFQSTLVNRWPLLDQFPDTLPQPTSTNEAEAGDLDALFRPFWEAWDIVHDQYVDQPVDNTLLMHGAIHGMLNSLGDRNTSYMDPDQYQQASIDLDGSYEGIGAYVDTEGEYLTIIAPMPNSPAEKAGLKPGDQVIAIDGEDMTGIDGSLVIRRVLGPDGTKVTLTILRENEPAPFDVEVIRAKITIPCVEYEMLDNNIGYLRLYDFGERATKDTEEALRDLMKDNPRGLIFDLRGNAGGYLTTAVDIASEFIDEGLILTERFGDGTEHTYNASKGGLSVEIPLVVLINGGSASASEIVAGAIQDHNRGTLIGETSFGKGSVQNWIPLSEDNGAVRVTVARWYTPNDRQIHEIGLEPDVPVELTEEDFLDGLDPQLDRAIEILTNSDD
jgi:carboxyl-terminal processing protease